MVATTHLVILYAPEDAPYGVALAKHLVLLQRPGLIECFHEGLLQGGDVTEARLSDEVARAQIVILLLSADFLASERNQALVHRILRERDHGQPHREVVPVPIRAVDWKHGPLARFPGLPRNERPVSSWARPDEAWMEVVQGIRELLAGSRAGTHVPHGPLYDGNLISIGSNIITAGEVEGTHGKQWSIQLQEPFLLGNIHHLIYFTSEFDRIARNERYLLLAALGDGYVIATAPKWGKNARGLYVTVEVEQRQARSDVKKLGKDMALRRTENGKYDFDLSRGLITGIDRVQQIMMRVLTAVQGGWYVDPEHGSRITEYYKKFGVSKILECLIKSEICRLAFVPRGSSQHNQREALFDFIERVLSVQFSDQPLRDGWLEIKVELEINGFQGLWSSDIDIAL